MSGLIRTVSRVPPPPSPDTPRRAAGPGAVTVPLPASKAETLYIKFISRPTNLQLHPPPPTHAIAKLEAEPKTDDQCRVTRATTDTRHASLVALRRARSSTSLKHITEAHH